MMRLHWWPSLPRSDYKPILGSAWVNDRFLTVLDGVYQLVDRLLATIYRDGYGPLEQPITEADIKKLTAEAFQQAVDAQPSLTAKAELIKTAAKLPGTEEELP
jgi:hypothetical protein